MSAFVVRFLLLSVVSVTIYQIFSLTGGGDSSSPGASRLPRSPSETGGAAAAGGNYDVYLDAIQALNRCVHTSIPNEQCASTRFGCMDGDIRCRCKNLRSLILPCVRQHASSHVSPQKCTAEETAKVVERYDVAAAAYCRAEGHAVFEDGSASMSTSATSSSSTGAFITKRDGVAKSYLIAALSAIMILLLF